MADGIAAYLYAQYAACPVQDRPGAVWFMSAEWLEVIDDVLGYPLPVVAGTKTILGRRVQVSSLAGRPKLV